MRKGSNKQNCGYTVICCEPIGLSTVGPMDQRIPTELNTPDSYRLAQICCVPQALQNYLASQSETAGASWCMGLENDGVEHIGLKVLPHVLRFRQ